MGKTYTVTMVNVDECCSYVPIGQYDSMEEAFVAHPRLATDSNLMLEVEEDD